MIPIGSLARNCHETPYSHLDMDKRRKIALGRTAGLSVELIAEKLGRHRSTIFRDIRRNTFTDAEFVNLNSYYCVTAHVMACVAWQLNGFFLTLCG